MKKEFLSDDESHKISRRGLFQKALLAGSTLLMNRIGYPSSYHMESPHNLNDILKRTIPSTNQQLPAIGMGTWRTFDIGRSAQERNSRKEVLKTLMDGGGNVIDSSPMYGSSEEVIGDLKVELKIQKPIFLATKVWTHGRENGIEQMEASFRKMKTRAMDLMQVHNLLDVDTHLKTLKAWKAEGKIRYTGITHYIPNAYPEMIRILKREKPDFAQFCYNIRVRDAENQILPFCKDNGIAVIINRPFEEGALFNVVQGKKLPAWTKDYGINNWAQYFLKYILSNTAVTCAIPATTNAQHMHENLLAGFGILPDEKVRRRMVEYFDSI